MVQIGDYTSKLTAPTKTATNVPDTNPVARVIESTANAASNAALGLASSTNNTLLNQRISAENAAIQNAAQAFEDRKAAQVKLYQDQVSAINNNNRYMLGAQFKQDSNTLFEQYKQKSLESGTPIGDDLNQHTLDLLNKYAEAIPDPIERSKFVERAVAELPTIDSKRVTHNVTLVDDMTKQVASSVHNELLSGFSAGRGSYDDNLAEFQNFLADSHLSAADKMKFNDEFQYDLTKTMLERNVEMDPMGTITAIRDLNRPVRPKDLESIISQAKDAQARYVKEADNRIKDFQLQLENSSGGAANLGDAAHKAAEDNRLRDYIHNQVGGKFDITNPKDVSKYLTTTQTKTLPQAIVNIIESVPNGNANNIQAARGLINNLKENFPNNYTNAISADTRAYFNTLENTLAYTGDIGEAVKKVNELHVMEPTKKEMIEDKFKSIYPSGTSTTKIAGDIVGQYKSFFGLAMDVDKDDRIFESLVPAYVNSIKSYIGSGVKPDLAKERALADIESKYQVVYAGQNEGFFAEGLNARQTLIPRRLGNYNIDANGVETSIKAAYADLEAKGFRFDTGALGQTPTTKLAFNRFMMIEQGTNRPYMGITLTNEATGEAVLDDGYPVVIKHYLDGKDASLAAGAGNTKAAGQKALLELNKSIQQQNLETINQLAGN